MFYWLDCLDCAKTIKMTEHSISHLLSYPFDEGVLARDDIGQTLVVNAPYWAGVNAFDTIRVMNSFFPDYKEWKDRGHQVSAEREEGERYNLVLCALPKQKEFTFSLIAESLKALNEGGLFVCVAANDAGGKRLEKWVQEFGVETHSLSKSKCRIVWAYKKGANTQIIDKYNTQGQAQIKDFQQQEFMTKPGIFGWNKIDQGSKLLTQYLPAELSGIGADFGCGYGFLSYYVLSNTTKIKKLYAIDADYHAVSCAQQNLKKFDQAIMQWTDLTTPVTCDQPLDFIIMNPPFHRGKKTDSDIGTQFIGTAHKALKKKGVLYMVANAYLPYEKTLAPLFSAIEKCDEKNGFKVYKAVK